MPRNALKLTPNQPTLVMKFGGTSVGSASAIAQAVQIIAKERADWPRLVVVVSALAGVTNLLIDSAQRAAEGDRQKYMSAAQELASRHEKIVTELVPDLARQSQVRQEIGHLVADFSSFCQAIAVLGEATPRALDMVTSFGERMSARLMVAALESAGLSAQLVESTHLIVTDDHFQAARPDMEATAQRTCQVLHPILAQGRLPVVTGFIAATSKGVTTTLGRGGSDYTAAILGVLLPANEVWIWTDVDGVMTADPRLVPAARTLSELSYNEVAEMAYFGAKVLHPKTIHPVIQAGIGLRVRNTFNPSHPGTCLVAEIDGKTSGVIKAVTAIRGLQMITLEGRGMLGVPGVAARIFTAVATTGASVPLIAEASSEQSICFAVSMDLTEKAITALEKALVDELAHGDIDRIWASGEVVIVSVVSPGLRRTAGVSGRIFNALGAQEINVIAISYGSSDLSISLVIDAEDLQRTLCALHELVEIQIEV